MAKQKKNSKKRRVRIKRVINHPNYFESNKEYPRHDIALLETIDELYNGYSSAAPACLPQTARTMGETEQIMNAAHGLDCFVAGYGQIAEKGPASSFLKSLKVTIFPDQYCASVNRVSTILISDWLTDLICLVV